MKTKYQAGDLSKIIASASPKASTPSADSTTEKNVFSEKKDKTQKSSLDRSGKKEKALDGISEKAGKKDTKNKEVTVQKKCNKRELVDKNFGLAKRSLTQNAASSVEKKVKPEHVIKVVEKQTNSKTKKRKKNRKSCGFYRRLEIKKKGFKQEEQHQKFVGKTEDSEAVGKSKVETPKLKQNDLKGKSSSVLKEKKHKINEGFATVAEPGLKKMKLKGESQPSSEDSDDGEAKDSDANKNDANENKSDNSSSDESSDDGEEKSSDDDNTDSDGESEDDLSYKQDSSVILNEESENSDGSDTEGELKYENMSKMDIVHAEGFCPPEGIVHESLKAKGEKRKPGMDSQKKDAGHVKKLKLEDTGKETGTRPRKDRLAKATTDRTVFVGNLSVKSTQKQLAKLFSKFGKVESTRFRTVPVNDPKLPKRVIAIKKDFHPQRNTLNGYVCFQNVESAKKALAMNGIEVDGFHIRVDMAGRHTLKDVKKSIFVGNLPLDIEEEAVREHFEDCGDIVNVRIVRDRRTCLGKGFCFVTFRDRDGVSFSMKLNESKLKGRKLRIESCESGKMTGSQKPKKAAKRIHQTDESSLQGSAKSKSDILKKRKKKTKQTTPSNVIKNPFQEEKVKHERMKQKVKHQKAVQSSKKDNVLKNDIEKIQTEGKTEMNPKKDVIFSKTSKYKKISDKSSRDISREMKGAKFGKGRNSSSQKFEKTSNAKGQNSTSKSFEKKRSNFGENPQLNRKYFDSAKQVSAFGIDNAVKKGKHIKFD